jgi:hypothetical protein
MSVYLLVEQKLAAVTVYRRPETGFQREVYASLDVSILLPEIGVELPLAEIYEGVAFVAEEDD